MEKQIEIPFLLLADNAYQPRFARQIENQFIYNLFSPVNGKDISKDINYFPTFIEIIIPFGIICYLKSVHLEENGEYIKDERMEKGLVRLPHGGNFKITFGMPKNMNKSTINRGDHLGSLIFSNNVKLIRYFPGTNNLLRYSRVDSTICRPIQIKSCAGIDLPSNGDYIIQPFQRIKVKTGLFFAIPINFCGIIFGRSGLADRFGISVLGGVIDPNFRGEIMVILINFGDSVFTVKHGDRIAQMVVLPSQQNILVECKLDSTDRGSNGFGSTGISSNLGESLNLFQNNSLMNIDISNTEVNNSAAKNNSVDFQKQFDELIKSLE